MAAALSFALEAKRCETRGLLVLFITLAHSILTFFMSFICARLHWRGFGGCRSGFGGGGW